MSLCKVIGVCFVLQVVNSKNTDSKTFLVVRLRGKDEEREKVSANIGHLLPVFTSLHLGDGCCGGGAARVHRVSPPNLQRQDREDSLYERQHHRYL